jgi:hypothetical protein
MWLMKRTIVDGWDTDKALEEATALGLTNETLKQFFVAQIQQRKREGPKDRTTGRYPSAVGSS